MSKQVQFHPAERVDRPDMQRASADYTYEELRDWFLWLAGKGVFDGFRVRVEDQMLHAGQITVMNGVALDHGGQFVNDQTGTTEQTITLGNTTREYWIEVEIDLVDSDADARAFWDHLAGTSGEEVEIPDVATRKALSWKVKTPIRANVANRIKAGAAYDPEGFRNDADSLVIPIAVIRTNDIGVVIGGPGAADTSDTDNDIANVGGVDYIEWPTLVGGAAWTFDSRFTSDRRPRWGEALVHPFNAGTDEDPNTVLTDFNVRTFKEMYDALATAVLHIKEGTDAHSGVGKLYQTWGRIDAVYAAGTGYLDVEMFLDAALTAPVTPNAGQLEQQTLQITSGRARGRYARILKQDRFHAAGVVRVYLQGYEDAAWREDPQIGDLVEVINHRETLWTEAPMPASSGRGLNDLDQEVVNARTDPTTSEVQTPTVTGGIDQQDALQKRLSANKTARWTCAPDLAGATGNQHADFVGAAAIAAGFGLVAPLTVHSGLIHFHPGDYDFTAIAGASSIFAPTAGDDIVLEGYGAVIDRRVGVTAPVFDFTVGGAKDQIVIRGFRFQHWNAECIDVEGCTNVLIEDCHFDNEAAVGGATATVINATTGTNVRIRNCRFTGGGRPVLANGGANVEVVGCVWDTTVAGTAAGECGEFIAGALTSSKITGNYVAGERSEPFLDAGGIGSLIGVAVETNVVFYTDYTGSDGALVHCGSWQRSTCTGNRVTNDTTLSGDCAAISGDATELRVTDNSFGSGFRTVLGDPSGGNDWERCTVHGNRIHARDNTALVSEEVAGVYLRDAIECSFSDNEIEAYNHNVGLGTLYGILVERDPTGSRFIGNHLAGDGGTPGTRELVAGINLGVQAAAFPGGAGTFSDVVISGNSISQSQLAAGLWATLLYDVVLNDNECRVREASTGGLLGLFYVYASVKVSGVVCVGNSLLGRPGTTGSAILHLYSSCPLAEHFVVSSNSVVDGEGSAPCIDLSSGGDVDHWTIENNTAQLNDNISLVLGLSTDLTHLVVQGNTLALPAASNVGIYLQGKAGAAADSHDIILANNVIENGGIDIGNCWAATIRGNTVSEAGGNGIDLIAGSEPTDSVITDNIVYECSSVGIELNAAERIVFCNNRLFDNNGGAGAVQADISGCTSITVMGNNLRSRAVPGTRGDMAVTGVTTLKPSHNVDSGDHGAGTILQDVDHWNDTRAV